MENKNNASGSRKENQNDGFIPAAIATATILQNVVLVANPEGPGVPRENGGGGENSVRLQIPYCGQPETTNLPVLDFDDLINNQSVVNADQGDGAGRASFDIPALDEAGVSNMASTSKTQSFQGASSDDDYDSDFAEPRPKSQKLNRTTSNCAPTSSVTVEGEAKKMTMEEQTKGYVLKPIISSSPKTCDTPMLRAALTGKRRSRAVIRRVTSEKKTPAKQQVRRRVAVKRRIAQKNKRVVPTATLPEEPVNVVVEPSCSTATLSVEPVIINKVEVTEQIPAQRSEESDSESDSSDSESDFEILSQVEHRDIVQNCYNLFRTFEREYEAKQERFQVANNNLKMVQLNKRGVDAELRRLDEERQRLVQRRAILAQSENECSQIVEEQRGDVEKASKKLNLFFKSKFKRFIK